jgi:hypothetical protein
MKLKKYIKENYLTEEKYKTEKNQTGHIHYASIDSDGDGKTTSTSTGKDHTHKVFQWIVQPAMEHLHNLGL